MADSLFGFNTSSNFIDDEGGGEPSEDAYDALNDETFGQDEDLLDWEQQHDKFASELESNRRNKSNIDVTASNQLEHALSQLVLDDDGPQLRTLGSSVWRHDAPAFSAPEPRAMPSIQNVCTVEELERQIRQNQISTNQRATGQIQQQGFNNQNYYSPRFPLLTQRPPGVQGTQTNTSVGEQITPSINQINQLSNIGGHQTLNNKTNSLLTQNVNQLSQSQSLNQFLALHNQPGNQFNQINPNLIQNSQNVPQINHQQIIQNQMSQGQNMNNQLGQNMNQLGQNMNQLGSNLNQIGQNNQMLQNFSQPGQNVNQLVHNVNQMNQNVNHINQTVNQSGQNVNQNQMSLNGNQFGPNINQYSQLMNQTMMPPPPGLPMPKQNFNPALNQYNTNFKASTPLSVLSKPEQQTLNQQQINSHMQQLNNQVPNQQLMNQQLSNQQNFVNQQHMMNQNSMSNQQQLSNQKLLTNQQLLLNQQLLSNPPSLPNQQQQQLPNQQVLTNQQQVTNQQPLPNLQQLTSQQPFSNQQLLTNHQALTAQQQSINNQQLANQQGNNQQQFANQQASNQQQFANQKANNQQLLSSQQMVNKQQLVNQNQLTNNQQLLNQQYIQQQLGNHTNQVNSNTNQIVQPSGSSANVKMQKSRVYNNSNQTKTLTSQSMVQMIQNTHPMLQFNNNQGYHNASHHPMLNRNNNNVFDNNSYAMQRHGGGGYGTNNNGAHLMNGDEGCSVSSDTDEYAGLMTNREKQWLINIQILQLNTGTPYIHDYYYTIFLDRQARKEIENVKEAHKANQQNHPFYSGVNSTENNRQRHNSVRHNSTSEDATPRTYEPAQFENSLGKLQCGSVTAPRKIIDVELVPETPPSQHPSRAPSRASTTNPYDVPREMKKTKQILLDIEALYLILLRLEELNDPLAISNALILKEREEKQKLLDAAQRETEERIEESNLFLKNIESVQKRLKAELSNKSETVDKRQVVNLAVSQKPAPMKNLLDEDKDEIVNKMFSGLLYGDRLPQLLNVRKGRAMLNRFLSRVNGSHPRLRAVWCRVLRSSSSVARRDDGTFGHIATHFKKYIECSSGWSAVVESCSILAEVLDPARTHYVLTSTFTLTCVCPLVEKASTLVNTPDATANERTWYKFLKTLARALKNTTLNVSRPLHPLPEAKLIHHMKQLESRTTIEILRRGKTAEFSELSKTDVSELLIKYLC